jgi:hypothetical protein
VSSLNPYQRHYKSGDRAPKWSALRIGTVLTIALLGLASAAMAGQFSLAMATRLQNPSVSLRFDANQPVALATLADGELQKGGTAKSLIQAEALSLRALRAQPLNARAARVLAFARKGLKKNEVKASQLINLAAKTSRRDLGTQIYLIEQAVAEDDIPTALTHYDIALRTDRKASGLLFPVLSSAISLPEIRTKFAPFVAKQPAWLMDFYEFHVQTSNNMGSLAAILPRKSRQRDMPRLLSLQSAIVQRLFELEGASQAYAFYATLPFFDKNRVQTANITTENLDNRHAIFSWLLFNQTSSGASLTSPTGIKAEKNQQALRLFAAPMITNIVAQKGLYLQAGTYQLTLSADLSEMTDGSKVLLSIQCLGKPPQPLVNQAITSAKTALSFTVQNGCIGQLLYIRITGGTDRNDAQAIINSIDLDKI